MSFAMKKEVSNPVVIMILFILMILKGYSFFLLIQNYLLFLIYKNDILNINIDKIDEHTTISIRIGCSRNKAF
jgi:hypothetical protein